MLSRVSNIKRRYGFDSNGQPLSRRALKSLYRNDSAPRQRLGRGWTENFTGTLHSQSNLESGGGAVAALESLPAPNARFVKA
jgi:hypothetical protein